MLEIEPETSHPNASQPLVTSQSVMLSLEAVSCLETASRQFLGALALVLVSGVIVLVLSRVSAMLSWPCSQDKAVSRHLSISSSSKL